MRRFSGLTVRPDGEPAAEGDDGPDDFDEAEGPRTLEKTVEGAEGAGEGKGQDEPRAAVFERVEDHAGGDGEEAEDGQGIQISLCMADGGRMKAGAAGYSE